MQVGRIRESVYVKSSYVKRNTCNLTRAAPQPGAGTCVAGKAHEIVHVLARKYGRHTHGVVVGRGHDAPFAVKRSEQPPERRGVDVRLVGKRDQHCVAWSVLENGGKTRD